ncbi:hypothetical protein [Enterobacter asburiae]|uniref:hypothetical protein n=1 Tax=Enterobacter asburiae TaxID=61645 RepID=UPI0025472DF7|nr:hypothetical protein [Enterobacter asburiae]
MTEKQIKLVCQQCMDRCAVGTRYFDKNNNPVSDPSLDECPGTLTACKLRHGDGNELPFGGFPGTSLIRS